MNLDNICVCILPYCTGMLHESTSDLLVAETNHMPCLIGKQNVVEKLRPWDIPRARMWGMYFSAADFRDAHFRDVHFRAADFRAANSRAADFRAANSRAADFRAANSRAADFDY